MNKKEYKIRIWFEKASKFWVITAEKGNKPYVATQGKTFIEAFKMLGDSIQLMERNE